MGNQKIAAPCRNRNKQKIVKTNFCVSKIQNSVSGYSRHSLLPKNEPKICRISYAEHQLTVCDT